MRAVPESFDSMLEELADAAAARVTLPDLGEVRRRARQRTVRRRLTASTLAVALLCVSGVAGAAIDGRFRRPDGVAALSAPASSAPSASRASGTAAAAPAPSPSASGGAVDPAYAMYAGVWASGSTEQNYLIVFPDGVVALGEKGVFPLCYGKVVVASTGSAAAGLSTHSSATASPASTSAASVLPFTAPPCDGVGVTDDLTLSGTGSSATLTYAMPLATGGTTYSRVASLDEAFPSGDTAMLKELPGEWVSIDAYKRVLRVGVDGTVSYATGSESATVGSGTGKIDEYYASSARALIGCTAAMLAQERVEGKTGATTTNSDCGVLLLTPGPKTGELSVYTGLGLEIFARND